MSECGAAHPERPSVTCTKIQGKCFYQHTATIWVGADREDVLWPNPLTPPKSTGRKGGIKREASPPKTAGTAAEAWDQHAEESRKFRRNDDPSTSHEAIERYEPKRETAKGRVLAFLRERPGQWVDAPELTAPDVGGFAGTRRLRELRDSGWNVETRVKPGSANTWQHRLIE